ncbi:two-component sensor histidine kinase [Paenibacillus sp. HJL G12]|uniref:Two-component sensor histidine kinase n=1 Tax=Paenibacillus dendrobii TaxID=2691084 RepID=A0A7X3ILB6_9BACL|nr:histidine kinase [Paenibacillus dendrobii]MWV46029.1 two-component sensor histidine kinase [Paenibacillus dendrobii]
MKLKTSTFTKILCVIILLLLCVVILYSFSYQRSVRLIREELTNSNLNRSAFFLYQIDTVMDQFTANGITLSSDPAVLEMTDRYLLQTYYNRTKIQNDLTSKLLLQRSATNWSNQISVYFPELKSVVSTDLDRVGYVEGYFKEHYAPNWTYRENDRTHEFFRQITYPPTASILQAQAVVETRIPTSNLSDLLDQLKMDGKGEPFLTDGSHIIAPHSSDTKLIYDVIAKLNEPSLQGYTTIRIDANDYIVSYAKSKTIGMYLVSYIPLTEILHPIAVSRNLFYASLLILLLLGAFAAMLLYRSVQIPIKQLIQRSNRIAMGNFSVQPFPRTGNEFEYLFQKFENMARSLAELIDKVYVETIRSRDATLKQLQSQINPHFLYNSLSFIVNMTKLKQDQAVIAMAHHLSDYFRYTTHVENQLATVQEEIQMISHYLEIQSMRSKRLRYEIDVSEGMFSLMIPRLIVQPLVENAILHGIEQRVGDGRIRITGEEHNGEYLLIIEDDGIEVTGELLDEMRQKINLPANPDTASEGCGLQNVHLRMKLHFGDDAGVRLNPAVPVGMRVILHWRCRDVSDSDRG